MSSNKESSLDNTKSDSTDNLISADINDDSNIFENKYDEGESSSSNHTPESESIKTTRTGHKIHTPSKYSNYTMLLFGLLTSQCMNNSNFQVDIYKQISFFKTQLDYI